MDNNSRIIKSYVWRPASKEHGPERCFFVSTIDRDSSAVLGPRRYAETLVWECEWNSAPTYSDSLYAQEEGPVGSTQTHYRVCEELRTGRESWLGKE